MEFKILILLCVMLATARVESSDYKKVGDTLTLTPDISSFPDPIKTILWKHGKDKIAELDPDFNSAVDYYGDFRRTLDTRTGHLVITDLQTSDTGVYSLELNSKLQETTFDIAVIKEVPEPKIVETCDTNTSCTLSCEGDTTGAEPVTYSWRGGEKVLGATDKQLTVSETDHQIETFTCQMKNPVSEKSSPPHKNPFYPEEVTEPKIVETCDTNTSCTLSCEGNTTRAEPVTYSWRGGEKVLGATDKQLTVTETDHKIETFTCQMKNPVSEKSSPPHKNPFYPEEVTEPKIVETCDTNTSCTLSCEGNTTRAEPVTYSWRGGEKVLGATDKQLTVTETDHQIETYTCQMKNPVSEKSSPPHKNPFYPEEVPEPKIVETCDTNTSCTLSCEGNTTGAEPVTYSWRGGEKVLGATDKQLTVTETDHKIEMYTCQMKNPVSEKSSPSHKNPFYPDKVPEPKITVKCETPKSSCTLTCEGDTTGAEPVTYSWRGGEKVLGATDKKLTVTETDHKIETFTCQMKNPVSEKSSPSLRNPFYPENVPEPKIIEICDIKSSCTLSCEGDTTGAEPVTYSWRGGEKVLGATDKQLTVTETDHQIETFTCQMKNPVSEKSSPPLKNPFYPDGLPAKVKIGISVFIIFLCTVLVIVVHRYMSGVWFYQKGVWCCLKAFWTKELESGAAELMDHLDPQYTANEGRVTDEPGGANGPNLAAEGDKVMEQDKMEETNETTL